MQLPEDFTQSWRGTLTPGKPCQMTLSRRTQCCIVGVSLDPARLPSSGKVTVFISVNRSPPIGIASLIAGRSEAAALDIRLGFGDSAVITVKGITHPVHIHGLATGGGSLQLGT
jgi:hypothetical protein